ncbi:MAG: SDR family oxidoreductase [Patescibacteria group bacterium]|nr:SDR family oxidoreductase [Patescibacteria group bacterium]
MSIEIFGNHELKERKPLSGKVAVVTGTSRGVGAEIAQILGFTGAYIIGSHVDPNKSARDDRVVYKVGRSQMESLLVDITKPEDRQKFVDAVKKRTDPKVDILVLNASGGLEKGKTDNWAEVINIDAQKGMIQDLMGLMAPRSKIIYLTSEYSERYGKVEQPPGYEPVARTKYLFEQNLKEQIEELEKRGIKVGIVSAAIIKDTATFYLFQRHSPEWLEKMRARMNQKDFPTPLDMALAVNYAVLDEDAESGKRYFVGEELAEFIK